GPLANACFALFPDSSAVEHSTVNRMVAGSNPAPGASFSAALLSFTPTRQRVIERRVAFWALLSQKVSGFRFDFGVPPMSGFSTARQKMVDGQVRTSDVTDSRILDAMLDVPREAFVPA